MQGTLWYAAEEEAGRVGGELSGMEMAWFDRLKDGN